MVSAFIVLIGDRINFGLACSIICIQLHLLLYAEVVMSYENPKCWLAMENLIGLKIMSSSITCESVCDASFFPDVVPLWESDMFRSHLLHHHPSVAGDALVLFP